MDHAEYSTRLGRLDAALYSVRAALEISPDHPRALLLLALTSLTRFQMHDSPSDPVAKQLLENACIAAHDLIKASGLDCGLPWALLAIIYSTGETGTQEDVFLLKGHPPSSHKLCSAILDPSLPGPCRKNLPWASCRQHLSHLERKALASGKSAVEANAFMALWAEALALGLLNVSDQARSNVACLQQSSKLLQYEVDVLGLERLLLPSESAEVTHLYAAGTKIARRLSRQSEAASASSEDNAILPLLDTRPILAQAEIAWRLGNTDQAIILYQKALQLSPSNHSIKVIAWIAQMRSH